ncbi:MAG: insulinase family protein [Desulfovibrio sp.]|nr:insulinase family protein [Desulfovibrio sp.]
MEKAMHECFCLLEKRDVAEVGGTASLWEHLPTKAQILSITNHDENKCFGVSFRTPPADSTGVAHIMEHSVLCGSDKYPVKEPFVELLKGSLQTFLNAFTFPDKTCYPVASANLQDFYNLIDVYLDAVFHPRISEDIFRQEGWHIEATSTEGPWTYKGVVLNEMKGAYSSPDSVLGEQSQQALFPDMLYSLDSGGNPEKIPDLTYDAFRSFHERYYHPSNARFFFWGDDPEEKRFSILEEVLQGYSFKAVDSAIPLQKPIMTPIRREVPYASGNNEQKAMFTINWLLAERGNVQEALQMEMLEHILEGMPGSPLQKALISSGLGEETTGCGLETDLRQMYYSTGLKGISREDIPQAEKLIFTTLETLANNGIPKETVAAAVNSVEFDYRESNTGRFPRGLAAMVHALSTWLYDGDPLAALSWEKPLQELKDRLAKGERLFEELIRKRFLNNTHRATVVLVPDAHLAAQREESEATVLQRIFDATSSSDRAFLVKETKRLQEAQVRPDSPEALATIPSLSIEDLPKRNAEIPERLVDGPCPYLAHEQDTLGIAYATLFMPLSSVPERLIPLLPLFARTMTEVGTSKHDYSALGDLISAKTGGLACGVTCGAIFGTDSFFRYLKVGGKAVYERLDDLFDLFHEILFCPLEDSKALLSRVGQMLLETRARLEEGMQSAGHGVVSARLSARYSPQGAFAERTQGVSYLNAIRSLIKTYESNPNAILDDLTLLRRAILGRKDMLVSCTAEAKGLDLAEKGLYTLAQELPQCPSVPEEVCDVLPMRDLPHKEVLITPARINYVGKSVNLYDAGFRYHGSVSVILRALRMGYLWENVRVRGGAYGAFCSFDRARGTLLCASYRDPNTEETLAAYDAMASYLTSFTPDSSQLTQAIVGAVGDLDTYYLPSARGALQLARYLSNDTAEQRQQMRDEMLSTKAEDFKRFAEVLALLKNGDSCVLGGQDARLLGERKGWSMTTLL